MVYPIAKWIVPPIMKLWIKKVEGLDNIPKGGFVICPNHSSFYDDLLLHILLVPKTNKPVHMYVNKKYFKGFLLRKFLEWGTSIPVEVYDHPEKKKINEKAFKDALSYLDNGDIVGVYPEGHRTLDGELQKAKVGAVKLALSARVPIVPVGITGSREILPKGKKFPKIKKVVTVKIGKPIYFDGHYEKKDDKGILVKITKDVMQNIGKLIGKRYRY
jgi:1-acyl-sn-glycerol-3-phosphate acyltransferase